MAAVDFVEKELRPNGGSSLRDAVDKLVHRTEALEDRIDGLDPPET